MRLLWTLIVMASLADMMMPARAMTGDVPNATGLQTEVPDELSELAEKYAKRRESAQMDYEAGRMSEEEFRKFDEKWASDLTEHASRLRKK